MKVELISLAGVDAAKKAAACCMQKEIPGEPDDGPFFSAIESGHTSVLEHIVASFAVSGISRACSHQLVRHRLASYSQQSQRYVVQHPFRYVKPESIEEDEATDVLYTQAMMAIMNAYSGLILSGIPEEDARYVLPNACETNIVVTMNLRELSHFCALRRCNRAQWEIRELADRMAGEVYSKLYEALNIAGKPLNIAIARSALIGRLFDPQCEQLGHCPEKQSCGGWAE